MPPIGQRPTKEPVKYDFSIGQPFQHAESFPEAVSRGYEGIVAKDSESRFVPERTLKWLKVKQKDYRLKERGFYDPQRTY